MTHDDLSEPFHTPTDAYRLEALGFYLAEQVITPDARGREERDEAFHRDLVPVRDLLRPHVFSERAARDAACQSPMPGNVFALEPAAAGELAFRWRTPCLFAIGHGIDDDGFEDVVATIADPEMVDLVERHVHWGGLDRKEPADSIVLTIAGAHYRILIDDEGPEVRAKAPFGVVSDDEVARTAAWLAHRMTEILNHETKADAGH